MVSYDPQSNDFLYSCSYFCPGHKPDEAIKTFFEIVEEQYKSNLNEIVKKDLDINYGPNKVDIWGDKSDKLFVFIHGGYWQHGCKEGATSIVKPLVDNNIQVASVGYTLANKIPLDKTIEEIKCCVSFLHKKYPISEIILSGHSAGAHLAAKACEDKKIGNIVKKLVLYSGVFKLHDLVGTYIGNPINLTMDNVNEYSVDFEKLKKNFKGKIVLFAGGFESPKIKQQSNHFANELNIPYHIIPNEDHFSYIKKLADITSPVTNMTISFINDDYNKNIEGYHYITMEKTTTGSEVRSKATVKENKQEENPTKDGEWTSVADTLKKNETPQLQENTNVSKDFLPKRTQSYTGTWKKKVEEQEKAQKQMGGIYGYTPFSRPTNSNATFNPNTLPDTIYGVRPGSAIPRAQIGGKVSFNGISSRPGSALDNIYSGGIQRPESRTGSEYGMPIIGSRYQSYTTLPRPEQLDSEQLNTYGPYSIYGNPQQIYGTTPRGRQIPVEGIYGIGGRNVMKGPSLSRPTSAMSNMMLPNGFGKPAYLNPAFSVSNIYMGQPAATTIPSKTAPIMLSSENVGYKRKGTLINNSGLSVCASMQVVSGLCFIGIGIARIALNAKWAFGIEVAFGFLSILAGLLGVIGLRNKNYSCSVASFIISNANTYFVIIPFLIGLIPLLPFHIRSDTFVVLIGNDEPIEVDIALTVLCIIQFFLSLTMSIFGCRAWGLTMDHVEHLRLRDVMREVYPGHINRQ